MENRSLNVVKYPGPHPIKALESICLKIADNLHTTKFRSEYDKKKLKDYKEEFAKVFHGLVQDKKILDIYIDGYGYMYQQKLTSETTAVLITHIYNTLKSFYTNDNLLSYASIQVAKKDIADVFMDEEDIDADISVSEESLDAFKKEKPLDDMVDEDIDSDSDISFWNEIWERLHLDDLSEDTCYMVFNDFDRDNYNPQELSDINLYLKRRLRSIKVSRQSEINDFLNFVYRELKEYLESRSARLSKENEKHMKDITNTVFASGIRFFDEFVNWVRENNLSIVDFTNFDSFDYLRKNKQQYATFLKFRQDFVVQYTTMVSASYDTLFKNDPNLDKFYYTNILTHIKNLWDMYSTSNMSDKQFFLWLKRNFLLWDIYEFLVKNIKDIPSDTKISPFMTQELNKYSSI